MPVASEHVPDHPAQGQRDRQNGDLVADVGGTPVGPDQGGGGARSRPWPPGSARHSTGTLTISASMVESTVTPDSTATISTQRATGGTMGWRLRSARHSRVMPGSRA